MRTVCLRLVAEGPAPHRHMLRAALYACAEPDDMVEHLYVEMGADQADLVFFLHDDIGDRALWTVRRLWERAVRNVPPLGEWTVLEATTLPLADPLDPDAP